jgi:DNA-binding winged helix-turn-helix (wHTH) protein/TolB-like protein/Tfp pilus assembly protein PilF
MRISKCAFSAFTFDAPAGVLKKNDRYLRVPPQTLVLLTALLERAGAVVTREELRAVLWPEGEFIDHEHAINRAVNYLRSVLRDDPKKPQFIETLPKRGYRFIAEVTHWPEKAEPVPEPTAVPLAVDTSSSAEKSIVEPALPAISGQAMPSIVEAAPQAREQLPSESLVYMEETFLHPAPRRAGWYPRLTSSLRRAPAVYAAIAGAAVLACALVATYVETRPAPLQAASSLSMGIVPFEVHGPQAGQLEQSFRMDLTDTLSQLPTVQLRASHSLEHVKTNDTSLREAAQALHLDLLLLGDLTVENNRCVLKLELVRGLDAVHLTAFQYVGSVQELTAIRDKAQKDIYSGLQLTGSSVQASAGSTQNPEAYSFYLRARELASRRTVATLNSALGQYLSATERDPNFARAYAGMASAYLHLASMADEVENLGEARTFALKAEQMNPRVAEAHAVLGVVALRRDWNMAQGDLELRRAIELEPNEAVYHAWLAESLADEGRSNEALKEVDLARADDPLWPQINGVELFVSGAAHQYARAVEAARRNVALDPNSSFARDQLAWSLFDAGSYEEAIGVWRETAVREKDTARVALEDRGLAALHQGGPAAYAEVRVSAIQDHLEAATTHPDDFIPEEWYAYAGDRDQAIAALQETIRRHDPSAVHIAVNPMLENLHSDPRFLALVSRVGLSLPPASALAAARHTPTNP